LYIGTGEAGNSVDSHSYILLSVGQNDWPGNFSQTFLNTPQTSALLA